MLSLIRTMLKDSKTGKESITKFIAFIYSIYLLLYLTGALFIMIILKKVDHYIIAEVIAFILSLLGMKNLFNKNMNHGVKDNENQQNDDSNKK